MRLTPDWKLVSADAYEIPSAEGALEDWAELRPS